MNQAPPEKKNQEEADEIPVRSMRALYKQLESIYFENQKVAALYIKGYSTKEIAEMINQPEDYVIDLVRTLLLYIKTGK